MNDIGDFLKKHAPQVPPAAIGEKERIWRAIEAQEHAFSWRDWFVLPRLRFALVSLALLVLVVAAQKHRAHDREVDRVLGAALGYQFEEVDY